MSDLISRSMYKSKLVKALDVLDKEYREALLNEDNDLILAIQNQQSAYMITLRLLDNEPTAYSVDKVVGELECDRCESCSLFEVCAGSKYCEKCHEKIIEIVRHGGVSDDVCEWKQTSTARYKTSCGYKLEEFFDTKACYCKQCGKKIKVVEWWRD